LKSHSYLLFRGYLQRQEVVSGEIDYDMLAKMSERFTGAGIEALVNKVFQRAFYSKVKEKKDEAVTEMTLEEAIKARGPQSAFRCWRSTRSSGQSISGKDGFRGARSRRSPTSSSMR